MPDRREQRCGPRRLRIGRGVVYLPADVEAWATAAGVQLHRAAPELATGPIECAPWCLYGDGHAEVKYREDQCCDSEIARVDLSQHPRLDGEPDYAQAYAFRRAGAATEYHVAHGDFPETRFTADEAVAFCRTMLALVEATRD